MKLNKTPEYYMNQLLGLCRWYFSGNMDESEFTVLGNEIIRRYDMSLKSMDEETYPNTRNCKSY